MPYNAVHKANITIKALWITGAWFLLLGLGYLTYIYMNRPEPLLHYLAGIFAGIVIGAVAVLVAQRWYDYVNRTDRTPGANF